MNLRTHTLLVTAAFLVSTPVNTKAAISCDSGRTATTIHIGVDPTAMDLPPRLGLPGAATANLKSIQLVWLPDDPMERTYFNEATTIDYGTQSQTGIDLVDGRNGSTQQDIAETELSAISNFPTGRISTTVCRPDGTQDGLVFGVYEHAGSTVGFKTSAFTVRAGEATTVANEETSKQLGLEFNTTGADKILENILTATAVDVARTVAEKIYQLAIPLQFNPELERMAMFNNPDGVIVYADKLIVIDDVTSTYIPAGVTGVTHNGTSVLSGGRVQDIDGKIDPVSHTAVFVQSVNGYDNRTITVLEGRTEQDISVSDCATTSRIQSNFKWGSTLDGTVSLYKNGQLITSVSDQLDETVACDGGMYQVIAGRVLEDANIPDWESGMYTLEGINSTQAAANYVDFWLTDNDSRHFLNNNEIRAMILGGQGTQSYANELATILVDHTPNIPFDISFWEQTLLDYADGNTTNDEFRTDIDPWQYDNDAQPPSGIRIYDRFPENSVTDFNMDATGMQEMYELIKGIDNNGQQNGGFLLNYVKNNPDLYGGTIGGVPLQNLQIILLPLQRF